MSLMEDEYSATNIMHFCLSLKENQHSVLDFVSMIETKALFCKKYVSNSHYVISK